MSAFLFIPSTRDDSSARRVDFADIGNLFVEPEEPPPPPHRRRSLLPRVALLMLVATGVIGAMLALARPGAMTDCLAVAHAAKPGTTVVGSWSARKPGGIKGGSGATGHVPRLILPLCRSNDSTAS